MSFVKALKSRTAAVTAFMSASAIVGTLIAIPTLKLFEDQQQRIQDSLKRLAVYRAETAMLPQFNQRLKEMQRAATSLAGLIKSENASVAAAQLQGDLKSIVEKSRGEVRAAQVLPGTEINGFEEVGVRNDVSIPITALRDLVYAVETHVPYFIIERMSIIGPRDWPTDLANAPEPRLEINWTVHAFRRMPPK